MTGFTLDWDFVHDEQTKSQGRCAFAKKDGAGALSRMCAN